MTEIIKLNNLDNNILSIGQELILSKPKEEEILSEQEIYIVQKGDSIWKISQKYNISPAELININNLSNNTLQIGQKLLVPKIISEENNNEYIVQKGDTLWSIAKKYNIPVNELKQINNLTNNLLEIGQVLKINNY